MEAELINAVEFDKAHPNYERWKRAREVSIERGKFVKSVVSNFTDCKNLKILDIGSGEGVTVKVFSEDNFVVSVEKNPFRLKKQAGYSRANLIISDAFNLPLRKENFDLIILQDCLEHLKFEKKLVEQLHQLLDKTGIIYLSTPNKYSILNIIADPHWGLPMLSLLKRKSIKKYFLKYFRKKDYLRDDIAELFSLIELRRIFSQNFEINLNTKFATAELLNENKGLVWSNFHFKLLALIKKLRLKNLLLRIVNDRNGFVNKIITPTFYLVLTKK
jgi:2-polyprenyl-3-methyl-5-hydroxy-6-metoxy-1,4-benzoquinol methylase